MTIRAECHPAPQWLVAIGQRATRPMLRRSQVELGTAAIRGEQLVRIPPVQFHSAGNTLHFQPRLQSQRHQKLGRAARLPGECPDTAAMQVIDALHLPAQQVARCFGDRLDVVVAKPFDRVMVLRQQFILP